MTYSSVSVEGLEDLVSKMQTAMMTIDSFTGQLGYSSIKNDMDDLGVTSEAMRTLRLIQDWIHDDELPSLRRRLNLARGLQQKSPNATMLTLDEALVDAMSSEEAEQRGRELAEAFNELGGVNEGFGDLMEDFEELAYDPDAMAGFYAELGPELAAMFAGTLGYPGNNAGDDSQRYLELMSIGLGTALMDETRPGDWYDMNEFFQETDNPVAAWGRLALLQYGDFSDSQFFVQMTVERTALDAFTQDDWADPYSNISAQNLYPHEHHMNVDLPANIAEMAFLTLGKHPEASRQALSGYEDFPLSSFVDRVYEAADYPHDRYELADAFGLAIESGVGAEGDPPRTEHTEEEAAFAFEFINASAGHDEVPYQIKDSLGRIGASYVHEMVAGSYVDDGELPGDRNSSMTDAPNDFPEGVGLEPSFYLSPEITYQFLGSFQDELYLSEPYDNAMGLLLSEQLDAAIQADQAGEGDGNRTQQVMELFGGASQLHYLARREYAADFDAQEEQRRAGVAQFYSSGMAIIPVPGAGHYLYWGFQVVANDKLSDWVSGGPGMEDQVVSENANAEAMRWYMTVQAMIENGVGEDAVPNAPAGLFEDGELKPMDEIFADEQLRQDFYDWVNENPELNGPSDDAQSGWNDGAHGVDTYIGATR
ncbi:hypothetical protein [Phytoactinopolyspora halotolerans]|uniref:Uncharacterized protein n=1 Tax=Phytoactinopolyspora halotolerans TaxID=1981512 RepID=A0A6L9S3V1_9ACTN|nr:hypothetical protein [Phytoactinopolyspora halotolerans]NED99107.1 hypothetical protein [Phytoactinopolyspora halotolerans]